MAPQPHYEIVLQNPNRYPEAAARRLRPWLERLVSALAAAGPVATAGAVAPVAQGTRWARPDASEPFAVRTLGVRFAGDREVRRANRIYRRQDKPTDVLSFPGDALQEGEGGGDGAHLGDILISVPAARRQASALGHDARRELKVLLLHGLLHCLGHDHETDDGEMERLERRLRREWVREESDAEDGQCPVLAKKVARRPPRGGRGTSLPAALPVRGAQPAGGLLRQDRTVSGDAGDGGDDGN